MRSPLIEAVLSSHSDVEWEYVPSLPLLEIDRKRSQRNQARVSVPVKPETVAQYRLAMSNGDEFPAIVVYPDGPNRYIVADGNHRTESAIAVGKTTHDAYLFVTDNPTTRQLLTFELNNVLTGMTPDDEDRDHQAVFLVRLGLTKEDAATRLRIPMNRVEDALAEHKAGDRAERLGIRREWRRIASKHARIRMNGVQLDSVFVAATKVTAEFGLTFLDAKRMISEVNKVTAGEQPQLQLIADIKTWLAAERKAKQLADAATSTTEGKIKVSRPGPMTNPMVRLRSHLQFFVNVERNVEAEVVSALDKSERDALIAQVAEAKRGLDRALEILSV